MVSLMRLFRIVEVIITLNGLFTTFFLRLRPRGEGEIENYILIITFIFIILYPDYF